MSARIHIKMRNGHVLVGSDAHYWPGKSSTAHRAFVKFADMYRPEILVQNGDVIDAATISRFPPIGWEKRPTIVQELAVARERLQEIEHASPASRFIWTLGNHDARFERRLATVAPEFAGVAGIHLRDHFPAWEPAWSVAVGGRDGVVIKHRFKGGTNAARQNAVSTGRSVLTGHLHSLKVSPLTDDNGTRFGVDGGMLADTHGPQFTGYLEDNTRDWRSGFVLLTFVNGKLLWPEVIHVVKPGTIEFRGKLIIVK